jgi:hypothetical protein
MLSQFCSIQSDANSFWFHLRCLSGTLASFGIWAVVTASSHAYDVTEVIVTPSSNNDPPAQKVRESVGQGENFRFVDPHISLPRNGKLQQIDFQAKGTFTKRDVEKRDPAEPTLKVQVHLSDFRVDRKALAIGLLTGIPTSLDGNRRSFTMSSFDGALPLTVETKAGDSWALTGSFQIGCTTDGKVFGTNNSKVNRMTGVIVFAGDRAFPTHEFLCEEPTSK